MMIFEMTFLENLYLCRKLHVCRKIALRLQFLSYRHGWHRVKARSLSYKNETKNVTQFDISTTFSDCFLNLYSETCKKKKFYFQILAKSILLNTTWYTGSSFRKSLMEIKQKVKRYVQKLPKISCPAKAVRNTMTLIYSPKNFLTHKMSLKVT